MSLAKIIEGMPMSSFKSVSGIELSQAELLEEVSFNFTEQIAMSEDEFEEQSDRRVLPSVCLRLLNQSLPVVIEEIEIALESYPDETYRKLFADLEWYQKLTAYVLSKVPSVYTILKSPRKVSRKSKFSSLSIELRLRLEAHVYKGIEQIFQANSSRVMN